MYRIALNTIIGGGPILPVFLIRIFLYLSIYESKPISNPFERLLKSAILVRKLVVDSAVNNENLVIADKEGKIKHVPAKELLKTSVK
jgi:hypothetical protein